MNNSDGLYTFKDVIEWEEINKIRIKQENRFRADDLQIYENALLKMTKKNPSHIDFSGDEVTIGKKSDLSPQEHQQLEECLKAFIPWKKGPFNLFGHQIDSEWQSQLKWNKFKPYIKNLSNKTIADIGCHNGYFMFKMLEFNPKLVVGFEPYKKHQLNFQLIQKLIQRDELIFELLGVEHCDLFPKFFDVIFCMGILYHHTDPIGILRKLHCSLKKGGQILIDCQGIEGEDSTCLLPQKRYAGAKGVWFLPTEKALVNMLMRANFSNIQVIHNEPLTQFEQRTTKWAPIKSLKDFLDPKDPSKTIEGYPAPRRVYIVAHK